MYLLILCLVKFLLKTFLYITIFFIAAIVGLKLRFEPVNAQCKCKVRLEGKIAVVTGGNSGIGLETARDLARRGATVVIASRDEKKSEAAVKDIIATTGNKNVFYRSLDLNHFSSIRKFADDINKNFDRLDILVNNAGCAGLRPSLTEDGIQKVIQINYVGPFFMTNLLLDKLAASKPSRIVIVSSKANLLHGFDPEDLGGTKNMTTSQIEMFKIYSNSKVLDIFWTKALAKRLPKGVTVNALHPGIVNTDIFQRLPKSVQKLIQWLCSWLFKTPEEGAQTSIHLCVAPKLEDVSGKYFAECEIVPAAKITDDDEMVERIWEKTMMIVKGK